MSDTAIEEKIHRMAVNHCEDYPGVEEADAREQLYALDSSLAGIKSANEDLHKLISELQDRLGMSNEEIFQLWDEVADDDELLKLS